VTSRPIATMYCCVLALGHGVAPSMLAASKCMRAEEEGAPVTALPGPTIAGRWSCTTGPGTGSHPARHSEAASE
jgi:hypothetical protein